MSGLAELVGVLPGSNLLESGARRQYVAVCISFSHDLHSDRKTALR